MNSRKNLIGKKYGKLTVIRNILLENNTFAVECLCECGKTKIVNRIYLMNNRTRSCGCLRLVEKNVLLNYVYYVYKTRAKTKNWDFDLTVEEFRIISMLNCFYCDGEPKNSRKSGSSRENFIYNGLDRVDSSKGYTLENSVPCCNICNKMKNKYSLIDFYKHIDKIVNSPTKDNSFILNLRNTKV